LRSLEYCASPAFILNVTSSESYSVRWIAEQFVALFGVSLHLTGVEAESALLSDARLSEKMFGLPAVGIEQAIEWVANWIREGGATWDKPTHFETRTGQY